MTWEEFVAARAALLFGTEHMVELSDEHAWVIKITIPPNFGLIPRVLCHPVVNLRAGSKTPTFRSAIEFLPATPLDYLERWIAANDVFGDDVTLAAVLEWADGNVSFVITQPQYHGAPAPEREIERFFEASGWKWLADASGYRLYFNYAFQVLAIDALPRNCYLHGDMLLPFDVILCHPDEELERFLKLYPE